MRILERDVKYIVLSAYLVALTSDDYFYYELHV